MDHQEGWISVKYEWYRRDDFKEIFQRKVIKIIIPIQGKPRNHYTVTQLVSNNDPSFSICSQHANNLAEWSPCTIKLALLFSLISKLKNIFVRFSLCNILFYHWDLCCLFSSTNVSESWMTEKCIFKRRLSIFLVFLMRICVFVTYIGNAPWK